MTIKFTKSILILINLLFMLSLSCSKLSNIKIGFVASLTGYASELGISARKGLYMALAEINKRGGIRGRKIELVIKDAASDPQKCLEVIKEFNRENVKIVIASVSSGTGILAVEYVNKHGMFMISPTISTSDLSNRDDNFFRLINSNKLMAAALAEKVVQKKIMKIAIIYESLNSSFTKVFANHFIEKYKQLKGRVVFIFSFKSNNRANLYQIALKTGLSGSEGAVILANGTDTALFCQQLYKLNYNRPLFASPWSMTNDLLIWGGGSVRNLIIIGIVDYNSENARYRKFKNEFIKRYRTKLSFITISTYECLYVISDAMKVNNKISIKDIKKTIIKIKRFNGLQSDFIINKFGDTIRPFFFFKIENNNFKRISL